MNSQTVTPPSPPVIDMAALKRKSVRGGMVTMTSQAISIAIQLTSTILLARLLTPDDYGVMAMVMAVTGFAGLFRDLGLSSAAIQKKDLTAAQQSNLFWLNVAMGATLTVLVAACSPLVAWFYGKPELTNVMLALSASFLIGSFGTQHGARLVREMQFARQAAAGIVGGITGLIISITLAVHGYSYWALVWSGLLGSLVTTFTLFLLSPFRPSLPSRGTEIRNMLRFGANVTAFDFVNYFSRNLDNLLIGRFVGAAPLGLYSRAYQLLMFPISAIRGPINAVAFPALSRLQDNPNAFRHYYCKITSLLAFASMPITAFAFVTSKDIIHLLLGEAWLGVTPLFSILALVSFIQPTLGQIGLVNLSLGMSKRYLHVGIFGAITASTGFLVGIHWGAMGVAVSYLITRYLFAIPSLILAFNGTPLNVSSYFSAIAKPATASAIACGATSLFQTFRPLPTSSIGSLALAMPVFILTYSIIFVLLPGGNSEFASHLRLLSPLRRSTQ